MTLKTIPAPAENMAPEEISRRAQAARSAQATWRRYSISERVEILRALWQEIRRRQDELLAVVHLETGKPLAEIEMMELATAHLIVRYFTSNAHRILQDQPAWRPWLLFNKRAYVRYTPRGVVGLITPWNLPFLIPFGDAVAAMLAGNAVLVKPSEWTTRSAQWIESAIKTSGLLPEGLFTVVTGGAEAGAQVVAESDMVLFTGSTKAGRSVGQAAAGRLIPAVLELGGKHPMVVFKDADISRAAKAAVWGSFANCGQLCVGVERVYVESEVHEAFTSAVRREMAGLRQGLSGEGVDIGRLIFPPQLGRIQDQLEDARSKGAKVIGGEVLDEANLVISPALVLDATHDMKLMTEETFGPVMPVMKVDRGEEGIRLSNAGPFGLSASLWTRDVAKAERLCGSVDAGMVSINDVLTHYAVCSLPFGGIKSSGLGRRHSDSGLRMFCWPQSVFVHEWPAGVPEPWWFPYESAKTKIVSWLMKLA